MKKNELFVNGALNRDYCKGQYVVNRNLNGKCNIGKVFATYYGRDTDTPRFKVEKVNGKVSDWYVDLCTVAPEGFEPSKALLEKNIGLE